MVAMATYIFHTLITGKVKIDIFLSQWGYLDLFFTKIFIELSFIFHMAFVQIAEYDWLPGRQKG